VTTLDVVKPKSKCCKDKPRCKRCPTVLKRLEGAGYAERLKDGRYVILELVPKKTYKAARAR
jgi:predicted transcriptional regulator of viral defense system